MRKLLTLILILCTATLFAEMRGGAQYDPDAARTNLSNVDAAATPSMASITLSDKIRAVWADILGDIYASGTVKVATGTAAAPAYSFGSDPDTGIYSAGANTLGFSVGGVAHMEIDSSGNVGIAVTPTAWASSFRALQISETTAIAQNGFGDSYFANNWYYDGTNTRYISDEPINIYSQVNGDHIWESAPLGTGGDIVVLSEHMRLTGGGNLLIGTSTDDGANKLQVNGSMRLIGGAAPTATEGTIYFNSTDKHFYGYNGTAWVQLDN